MIFSISIIIFMNIEYGISHHSHPLATTIMKATSFYLLCNVITVNELSQQLASCVHSSCLYYGAPLFLTVQ